MTAVMLFCRSAAGEMAAAVAPMTAALVADTTAGVAIGLPVALTPDDSTVPLAVTLAGAADGDPTVSTATCEVAAACDAVADGVPVAATVAVAAAVACDAAA